MCWSVPRWAVPHAPFVLGTKDTTHASEENADGYYVASSWCSIFGNSWRVATNAVTDTRSSAVHQSHMATTHLSWRRFSCFCDSNDSNDYNVSAYVPCRQQHDMWKRLSVDRVTRLHQTSRYDAPPDGDGGIEREAGHPSKDSF